MKLDDQLITAKEIAREVHKGQKRPIGNKDYITHPEAVANSLDGYELKIVAWLHDVLEDSDLWHHDLTDKGIQLDLVQAVINLTRNKGQDYKDYILQIKYSPEIVIKVKIADLKHNLSDLKKGSLRDKYLLALHILEEHSHSS